MVTQKSKQQSHRDLDKRLKSAKHQPGNNFLIQGTTQVPRTDEGVQTTSTITDKMRLASTTSNWPPSTASNTDRPTSSANQQQLQTTFGSSQSSCNYATAFRKSKPPSVNFPVISG